MALFTPKDELETLLLSPYLVQGIYVIAKLGIPDFLEPGPKSSVELAVLTKTHEPSLYQMLRTLTVIGILQESTPKLFELTPLSQHLRSNHPRSVRNFALYLQMDGCQGFRAQLEKAVRSGTSASELAHGEHYYKYLESHTEERDTFYKHLNSLSIGDTRIFLDVLDVTGVETFVDIGGGTGVLTEAILTEYPTIQKGIIFELGAAVAARDSIHGKSSALDRMTWVDGDLFKDEVPPGGELYLIRYVLHVFQDDKALLILKNIRRGMTRNSRLVIVEQVLVSNSPSSWGSYLDAFMQGIHGKERTKKEFSELLAQAEFPEPTFTPVPECTCYLIESRIG